MLTAKQIEERKDRIGASDANIICGGDEDKIYRLWQEKRGEVEPEDLSGVFPVQLGLYTESFNLDWAEKTLGPITRRGEEITINESFPLMATLDGVARDGRPIDAKHVGQFQKEDDIRRKYAPQMALQMYTLGASYGYLSVIFGNQHKILDVQHEDFYLADVLDACERFWRCVESGEPPVATTVEPTDHDDMREVSMEGSNEWAAAAFDWKANRDAARTFDQAGKDLKKLVEPDVKLAYGYGIEVARDKRGSLRIKEI